MNDERVVMMMARTTTFTWVCCLLCGIACANPQIAQPPPAAAVIIDPAKIEILVDGKDGKTRGAAEELKQHLTLIGGVDTPIVDKTRPGSYVFRFAPGIIDGNREACAWESAAAETVFSGHVGFAVIDFLENALGVRWPEGDFISYTVQNPLTLSCTNGMWAPKLNIRTIRSSGKVFSHRMRDGRHNAPVYGHAFTQYWKKYGKTHREYFAMRKDGLRGSSRLKDSDLMGNIAEYAAAKNAGRVAMCCTSTGLVAQIVANWIKEGKPDYINLCENDVPGQESCHCPACTALDVVPENVDPKWETHYADRYVYFGNRVLEAARKYRPDVKICYYAYNATQDAPRMQRPDPATVIGAVPTIFSDKYVADYIQSWKNTGVKNFFYRPNRHHYYICPYLPVGGEEHFYGILQYLIGAGAIGFDYDARKPEKGGFEWFERYVLFHAMQDPAKPFSYWEDHYFKAYGAAAEDVKSYYRFWREEVWNKRLEPDIEEITRKGKWFNFGRGLAWNLGKYYHAEDFAAAERFVAAAEAKDLPPPQRELVKRLRVAHEHAKVFFDAVAHKSKANTEKLIAFRKRHGYPLYRWSEQYFGDITGVQKLLGPEIKSKDDGR